MVAPVVIPVVDEGLGNSSYLVELGDHQALAVDASLDLRALRAEAERRELRVKFAALLIWAPSWGWVIAASVLLANNQGLTWPVTVIMKMDLVGPARRDLAMGLNEAAEYLAVAVTAMATGYLAESYGLRPSPFLLEAAYSALGLSLSTLAVRETVAIAVSPPARCWRV